MAVDGQRAASLLLSILEGRKEPPAATVSTGADQLSVAYNRLSELSKTLRAQQDASLNLSVAPTAPEPRAEASPARAPEPIPQLEESRILGVSVRHGSPRAGISFTLNGTTDIMANSRAAASAIRSLQEKIRRLEGDNKELRLRLEEEKKRVEGVERQMKEREGQRVKEARDAAIREEVLRRDNAEMLRTVENLRAELRSYQGAEAEKKAAFGRVEELQREAGRRAEELQREWAAKLRDAELALAACQEELAAARGRGGSDVASARRAEQEERARRIAAEEARSKADEAVKTLLSVNEELVTRLEEVAGASPDASRSASAPRARLARARRRYEIATGKVLGSNGACSRYQRPASVRRKLPTDFADEVAARTSAETLYPLAGGLQGSLRAANDGVDPPYVPAGKGGPSHSLPANVQRGLADRPRAWAEEAGSSGGGSEAAAIGAAAAAREEALVDPEGFLQAAIDLAADELAASEAEYQRLLGRSQLASELPVAERAALNEQTFAALQRTQQKAEQLRLLRQHREELREKMQRFLPAPGGAAEDKIKVLRLYNQIRAHARA
eukprot:tig00001154_g7301.t1